MYMKLFMMLFVPIFFLGCGVNEDIHKETLNELQAKKAELKMALSETADANKKIGGLQKTMQEKEQEISKLSASVSAKEQKINELSAEMSVALDTKKAELDRALSKTAEANKKIGGLQKTMQEKEQEISELSASVSAKEQKINELSAEMSAALDTKNAELDRTLSETAEVYEKIGGLQKTMQEKEQEISELSASVFVKEQRIEELVAEMFAALDTNNAALGKALSQKGEANEKIDALQKAVKEKEQELIEVSVEMSAALDEKEAETSAALDAKNRELSASVFVKEQRIEELVAEMFAALEINNAALGKALSQRSEFSEKIDALQKTVQEKEQELIEISVEMSATLDAKEQKINELSAEMSAALDAKEAEKSAALDAKNSELSAIVFAKEQRIEELVTEMFAALEINNAALGKALSQRGEANKKIDALQKAVQEKEQELLEVSIEMSAASEANNTALGKALSQTAKANEKIDALQNRMEGKEQLNKVLSSGLSEKVQWISDISTEKEKELENFKNTYESLVKTLGDEVKRGEIKISRAVDTLLVKIVDKILFASGKTTIKKSGREVLQKIGDVLETVKNRQIMIKGHTDNVPIGKKIKEKFPSNWELSAMRAINVVHYLKEKVGISPETLSATGYSKFRPVATNDSAEGRAQNRRIEIALLPLDVNKVLKDLEN